MDFEKIGGIRWPLMRHAARAVSVSLFSLLVGCAASSTTGQRATDSQAGRELHETTVSSVPEWTGSYSGTGAYFSNTNGWEQGCDVQLLIQQSAGKSGFLSLAGTATPNRAHGFSVHVQATGTNLSGSTQANGRSAKYELNKSGDLVVGSVSFYQGPEAGIPVETFQFQVEKTR